MKNNNQTSFGLFEFLFKYINITRKRKNCKHKWVLTGEARFDYTCLKCGKNE